MEGIRVNWQKFIDVKTKIGRPNPIIVLRAGNQRNNSPLNILKRTIRRAWTINGPLDYWDNARKSTTVRIYRSLPLNRNKRKRIQENSRKNLSTQTWCLSKTENSSEVPNVISRDDSKRKEKISPRHTERKSNIPIFRRHSQEFEDLGNLRESKRSSITTIPQRYRGSADDLRRYRDDINTPSHIPKLLISPRQKENKLKKVESKDTQLLDIHDQSPLKESNELSTANSPDDAESVDKLSRYKLITNETLTFNNARPLSDTLNVLDICVENNEVINIKNEQQLSLVNNANLKNDTNTVVMGKQQSDDLQRRKYSKDDLFVDDTEEETRIRRPSSHLSPEASPLSTRSSKYSPRESESEPTPGLPRKTTSGDTSVSSQRIRDAITRTRRESNSSTRCESSGSESMRLSESGLHDYTDLARRVRLFGNNYYCPRTSVESDEPVPRDSATSAGEDESHEDCLLRDPSRYPSASSSSSSQGRTILRRRRQFDSQGSRRRGKSHARSCCSEELLNLQIARHPSPLRSGYKAINGQDPSIPDYRRLVFISSDSSSGREEDDADSSCSSSSYLNGFPRNSHAQSLDDCDWDYFESDSLPLPSALSGGLRSHYIAAHIKDTGRNWDCCLGQRSGACLACGGSPGRNVVPVPVPIPVPVPYPVPVPASLWNNGNFIVTAPSMIATTTATTITTTTTTTTGNESSLTLKNIPVASAAVPWFAWHPRFHQPNEIYGATGSNRTSSRISNTFDPANYTFQYYGTIQEYKNFILSANNALNSDSEKMPGKFPRDEMTTATITSTITTTTIGTTTTATTTTTTTTTTIMTSTSAPLTTISTVAETISATMIYSNEAKCDDQKITSVETDCSSVTIESLSDNALFNQTVDTESSLMNNKTNDNDILSLMKDSYDSNCVSCSDAGSSSGRSSADSSDLEESSSHCFSRIFVVNDDSLTSDNDDIQHSEDVDGIESDVQLDNAASLADNSIILKRVITLSDEEPIILQHVKSFDENLSTPPKLKIRTKRREQSEIYVGDSIDTSDTCVKLQSIRAINPDDDDRNRMNESKYKVNQMAVEMKPLDSSVTPDSLEVIEAANCNENNLLDIELLLNQSKKPTTVAWSNFSKQNKSTKDYVNVDANMSIQVTNTEEKSSSDITEFADSSQNIDVAMNENMTEIIAEQKEINTRDIITSKIHEIYKKVDSINAIEQESTTTRKMTIESGVKGETYEKSLDGHQVRESQQNGAASCNSNNMCDKSGEFVAARGMARFRSVERRPPTRKENVLFSTVSNAEKEQPANITNNSSTNNKYKSLVMITQDGYQPVSVVTTDTTTLTLQSNDVDSTQGLAGYYHLALEALKEPQLRKGQGPRRPLMVKRIAATPITSNEQETDSGLSVGSASESESTNDKYRVLNKDIKNNVETDTKSLVGKTSSLLSSSSSSSSSTSSSSSSSPSSSSSSSSPSSSSPSSSTPTSSSFSSLSRVLQSNDNNGVTGIVILEEGLADDDSWVEEVSHDEDEQSGTTATEESSEDELNNVGDREEELRGYHRQAIDFTLHTIVEESCEESEAEPSFGLKNSKKIRPPSASDLEKYFFFGLGGDNTINDHTVNNHNEDNTNANAFSNSTNNNKNEITQEIDSLSETSSVYSEVLESLGHDDVVFNKETNANDFSTSSRLEKYFLSEFLGFDKDRRDSDGSVGSDSEGRPSPEAQRRKRLVRARGTGRSHSSSLDNLLALTQSNQNLSTQNSMQDLSMNQDSQDTQSENSSTENDGMEDGQTAVFGVDGQFDTVKRKKKKMRNLGSQSPRIVEDRNKSPEMKDGSVKSSEMMNIENDAYLIQSDICQDDNENVNVNENFSDNGINESKDDKKTNIKNNDIEGIVEDNSEINESDTMYSQSIPNTSNTASEFNTDDRQNASDVTPNRNKQQSRDSGFIGSCDDLLHQKSSTIDSKTDCGFKDSDADSRRIKDNTSSPSINKFLQTPNNLPPPIANTSLSRKDSFNNWSSDEETNLMMSKMRQFFKTMVANSNGPTGTTVNNSTNSNNNVNSGINNSSKINKNNNSKNNNCAYDNNSGNSNNSTTPSPLPSPRLSGYTSGKSRHNRTKPPQLVYFENELTRLMKTVPGIRDDQVREIVEYLSSEDTWSDSYDSSDYTSSDLEGAAGGRRSALQEQISQSCQQIINKFDITSNERGKEAEISIPTNTCVGRDTAFVYQKLVQSFTKMASDSVSSDASSTPHSSPPLIAKVMHHIGSRLVALMHQVSEGNSSVPQHSSSWRRYSQHHRTPSSASTTEDDDSTSDSTHTPASSHFQLPRSKSHDPLLYINGHPTTAMGQEGEEREASDYERFSWRGSFESALMAADSRTKLSLLACSGDINADASVSALAMAAKRRSAGDLLFNPKSFSREQLDRVRSCGSIGGGNSPATGTGVALVGGVESIEEKIWSNQRRSSVPDANTRGESGASAGDDDTEDELEYPGDSRATTLPRGLAAVNSSNVATNSLPRLPASNVSPMNPTVVAHSPMHKSHSMYHFLPQYTGVKSARYRPPGFARNSLSTNNNNNSAGSVGPKRAFSAPGLQIAGSHNQQINVKREREASRSRRREQAISLMPDDGGSLSEACSTPIIGGANPRLTASRTIIDIDDIERSGLHSGLHHHHGSHINTRASLSSLGARSDSLASVYSGAGEGRWCGSVAVRGEVEFSLQYDYKQLTFQVHVNQCRDLAPVDLKRNRSDPYVKVYLLPDKSKGGKRKTKVKKHTLNPVFDETLKFHMNLNGLETRTLWLTVWHSDMFGRNDFLGEVRMPLENKIFDDPTPQWYPLQERTEPFDDPIAYKGEVIVGLKFVPPDPIQLECEREVGGIDRVSGIVKGKKNLNRGSLHVLVKEARNLQTRTKNSGTCDPFCKSYLLPDKGRAGKQKTPVVRRSLGSPLWNHTFIYKNVSIQELAERGLELTVWDHDRIGSNEFLGGVRFNLGTGKNYGKSVDWMDATGRELSLWQSMLERPNFWVEGAVTLRPNLHNHGKTSAP